MTSLGDCYWVISLVTAAETIWLCTLTFLSLASPSLQPRFVTLHPRMPFLHPFELVIPQRNRGPQRAFFARWGGSGAIRFSSHHTPETQQVASPFYRNWREPASAPTMMSSFISFPPHASRLFARCDAGRDAVMKEAHEVELVWPCSDGPVGGIGSGFGCNGMWRWQYCVHVGRWSAIQPDHRLSGR